MCACVCVCKKRAAQAEDGGRTPKASEEWPHITYTFLKACARALTQVSRWQKDFLLSIRRNCFPILVLSRSLVPPGFLRSAIFLVCFTLSFWQAFLRSFQCPGQWQWLPARVRNTQRTHRFLVPLLVLVIGTHALNTHTTLRPRLGGSDWGGGVVLEWSFSPYA